MLEGGAAASGFSAGQNPTAISAKPSTKHPRRAVQAFNVGHHSAGLLRLMALFKTFRSHRWLESQRKQVAGGRGRTSLWGGTMRLHKATPPGPAGGSGSATVDTIHLVAYGLNNGASSAAAATALPVSFDAHVVSIGEIGAHIGPGFVSATKAPIENVEIVRVRHPCAPRIAGADCS